MNRHTVSVPSAEAARPCLRALAAGAIAALCLLVPGHAAAAPTLASWDRAQQRQVVRAGLMHNLGRSFGGADPISVGQANAAMSALGAYLGPSAAAGRPAAGGMHIAQEPVTVASFDRLLVEELGLSDVASHVQGAAGGAGLSPPGYFGAEVVARFLGVRANHPAGSDQLELFASDRITRAEAAWSLAQVIDAGSWSVSSARAALSAFQLPQMSANQRQALRIAVSRIGYPYVWGGTTDDTSDGLAHGGFDCSGFAQRVYKVSGLRWGHKIQGRTAAQQAGEIPRRQRVPLTQLKPGDLLFFGSAHFRGAATEASIIHEGIYLGDNWVIHSSDQGVYVLPLSGSWLGDSFAWGRRVVT